MKKVFLLLIVASNVNADTAIYNKGKLNIECTCKIFGEINPSEWHHIVEINKDGLSIDMDMHCEHKASEYDEAELCSSDYKGVEYAFDPA